MMRSSSCKMHRYSSYDPSMRLTKHTKELHQVA